MRRRAVAAGLLGLLAGCGGGERSAAVPAPSPAPSRVPPSSLVVDSALCDDLRALAAGSGSAEQAGRVLEQAEGSGVLPLEVVQALRATAGGGTPAPGVLPAYAAAQCPTG